jgi:hypothetical protein
MVMMKNTVKWMGASVHGPTMRNAYRVGGNNPVTGTIPMMSTPNMMLRFIDEEENEQFAWVGYRRQGTVTTSNAPYNWEVDVITSTAPGNENSNCDWFAVDYASGGFQWETVDLLPAIVGFPTQGRTALYFEKYKMVSNLCDGSFD